VQHGTELIGIQLVGVFLSKYRPNQCPTRQVSAMRDASPVYAVARVKRLLFLQVKINILTAENVCIFILQLSAKTRTLTSYVEVLSGSQ
jgi:hypothetical protein